MALPASAARILVGVQAPLIRALAAHVYWKLATQMKELIETLDARWGEINRELKRPSIGFWHAVMSIPHRRRLRNELEKVERAMLVDAMTHARGLRY